MGTSWRIYSEASAKADSTLECSQAVPNPGTSWALSRLTSGVESDPVHSTRYGRQRKTMFLYVSKLLLSQHKTWTERGLCSQVKPHAIIAA